jgi:phosphatidylethanolamine/phosphatidyl-N-methylethanolamine N-methyltransferase
MERAMENQHNQSIYRIYAPIYDLAMRPFSNAARQRAVEMVAAQPGERLLIPGVGTGLDLPLVSESVHITATDLSPAMLAQARGKASGGAVVFAIMDAHTLGFPDASFDAVLLNLILSVVPDGAAAFREAWRVLHPGGRAVIFDKFLPEGQVVSPMRRAIGSVISWLGTDPNRYLTDVIDSEGVRAIELDEPSLLRGHYRIVLLRKPLTNGNGQKAV